MTSAQLSLHDEQRDDVRLAVSRTEDVDAWIAERHYLKSTPCGARLRFWVLVGEERVGAMMWGRPTSSHLDQARILELTRMCFVDDTQPFIESRALGMARSYIRKHMTGVKGLLAYSSEGQGHEGTVYKADGWFQVGASKNDNHWGKYKRQGRADRDLSPKKRWVRSP